MGKRCFTLIELVVVLAIIAITTGLVASAFRGETPSQKLENTTLEFEAWCATVRYRSAETGRDFLVKYTANGKELVATPDYTDAEVEKINIDNETTIERHVWHVPESCTLTTADGVEMDMALEDEAEVIRFFPDGGAQALHRLVLKCDKLAKTWDFSFLNGRMIAIDGDGSDEDMNNNREE